MATTKAYELGQLGGTISVNADDIITFPENSKIGDGSIAKSDLVIAPEVLEIQVQAPAAGQATDWQWTWEQSTLPYARRTITNSPELNVPLYKEGTYTINNFAKTQFGSMTQTHSLFLKWIDGAGTENLVSWSTDQGTFTDSHPNINSGNDTTVQRLSISVPGTITLPTLTAPSTVEYDVANSGSGAYTFSGDAAGNNVNIGPLYRGGTYTFNITASGHPFYFTTDNGTNFSAGTYFGEYTSGVTGSRTDSGTVTIVVPANAPDTLYYQCGNHSAMRGAITVKDLEVETNIDGNYVIYAQHSQEGHKTPVELRPIPSLVNQMCLVYDATSGKFVPQDLATYVENTPSFENKIREVAGTAELVVEDGSAVIAKVNVYDDSTYLPLTGNNAGDQAFATDTDILYIWDGTAWQQAGAANTDDLTEGTTNLFFTDARADARIAAADTGDLTEGSNLYYTDARARAAISGTGSLSYNSSSGVMSFTQGNTDTITEGSTNLFYTDARADTRAQLKVDALVDAAPNTLDTLNELAAALGDDPNFATTTATNIGNKANKTLTVSAGGGLTGGGDLTANRTISHADTSTVSDVNGSGNTFIQDIGFDTYGHVTSVGTGTVTVGDGAMTVTAGSGLSGGGQLGTANQSGASSVTVSHADTSSQASVNNSNGTVIQDITLDTYGHITGIASANLDSRFVIRDFQDTSRNLNIATNSTNTSMGLFMKNSSGGFGFQLYGDGSNYGFLHADWGAWDIQKAVSGQFKVDEGSGLQRVFNDGYHPNADKWTTARTLSLTGDASGSVSWDGSANATLSVSVGDADTLDGLNSTQFLRNDTAGVLTVNSASPSPEMLKFANSTSGGSIHLGFQQNDTDGMHHRLYLKAYKSAAGLAAGKVDIIVRGAGGSTTSDVLTLEANQPPKWSGNTIWHAGNDGVGSGLDADLLDGQHGSYYYSPANPPAAGAAESFVTYSSAPSSSSAGDVYYNTTEDKAYISNGTIWAPFTNSPPEPTSGTRSLSQTKGSAFSHNLDTDFTDDQPITDAVYTLNTGSLPPGISISGNLLSGTPTSVGTYTFGISGRDALGSEGTDKSYSFVVNPQPFAATGGTEFTSGGYKYHKFTSSGTLTVTGDSGKSAEVLMVAGGGAGGRDDYSGGRGAGGGGAGGLIDTQTISNLQSSLTIVVGAGGGGSGSSGGAGGNGGNTTVTGLSTAIGGGGGGGHNASTNLNNATSGGSGGGGTNSQSGKSGTSGQGNSGGRGAQPAPYGGGAGGGKNGSGNIGRNEGNANGGSGTNSYSTWASATSSGDSGYFAGGGAGGGGGVSASSGGAGGGGNSLGGAGQANTGGGGAGSRYAPGASGGSGIVIIRYLV